MKKLTQYSLFIILILSLNAFAAASILTPLEESNYHLLPKSKEISYFLHRLTEKSVIAKIVVLGKTAGGLDIEAVLISKDQQFLQKGISSSNKLTVMLIGSQHGTEESGAEALQILTRDIVNDKEGLLFLEYMNFIIVVNGNPDGRDNKSRYNQYNANINVGYIKLEENETLAFVNALSTYQPNIIFDLHESSAGKKILTDKQGYLTTFDSQFDVMNNPNIAASLRKFAADKFLPVVMAKNETKGVSARHYSGEIQELEQPIFQGGSLRLWNFRNYSGMKGAISILVENRIDPRNGNYLTPENIQERIRKQKISIDALLETAFFYRKDILTVTRQARQDFASAENREDLFLKYEAQHNIKQPKLEIDLLNVKTNRHEMREFPYYSEIKLSTPVKKVLGYLITDEQKRFSKLLSRHRVSFEIIKKEYTVKAMQPLIQKVELSADRPGQANAIKIVAEEKYVEIHAKEGDLWVSLDQEFGRLIPLLLDPRSSDSIFQEVEYQPLLFKNKSFFINAVI